MEHGPYVLHEFGADVEAHYRSHLGWLTAACFSSIPWPEDDVRVVYDGDDYFLRGVRECGGHRGGPALTMRCAEGQALEVMAKIYRFASILGWFKGGYVDIGGYITSSHPVLYSEPQSFSSLIAGGPHGFDCNYMPLIRNEATRRALAYWREGLRLRNIHTGYSFLSFFKVLESQFERAADRITWISETLPRLEGDAAKRVDELATECKDVGSHIYQSGRCAVAHARFSDGRGDPDVPEDRGRLSKDLVIIEALARTYITDVLQAPNDRAVYRTRDRLEPISTFVPRDVWDTLKSGAFASRRHLGLNGLLAGIAHWPGKPISELAQLRLRVTEVRDGRTLVEAYSASGAICVSFEFDFPAGKAHIDLMRTHYRQPRAGEAPDEAIAVVKLRKEVLGNGRMELWLPNASRVDFEVLIPVNIDISGSWRLMDAEIEALEKQRPATSP